MSRQSDASAKEPSSPTASANTPAVAHLRSSAPSPPLPRHAFAANPSPCPPRSQAALQVAPRSEPAASNPCYQAIPAHGRPLRGLESALTRKTPQCPGSVRGGIAIAVPDTPKQLGSTVRPGCSETRNFHRRAARPQAAGNRCRALSRPAADPLPAAHRSRLKLARHSLRIFVHFLTSNYLWPQSRPIPHSVSSWLICLDSESRPGTQSINSAVPIPKSNRAPHRSPRKSIAWEIEQTGDSGPRTAATTARSKPQARCTSSAALAGRVRRVPAILGFVAVAVSHHRLLREGHDLRALPLTQEPGSRAS